MKNTQIIEQYLWYNCSFCMINCMIIRQSTWELFWIFVLSQKFLGEIRNRLFRNQIYSKIVHLTLENNSCTELKIWMKKITLKVNEVSWTTLSLINEKIRFHAENMLSQRPPNSHVKSKLSIVLNAWQSILMNKLNVLFVQTSRIIVKELFEIISIIFENISYRQNVLQIYYSA